MTRAATRVLVGLALPACTLAWALRGSRGAWTAAGALVLVLAWFALSALSMGWAAQRSLALLQAVALGGFATRVGLMGIGMVTLAPAAGPTGPIDGPVLAVTVGVGVVALLAFEVRTVLRRADLWWVDADARPAAVTVPGNVRGTVRGTVKEIA